MLGKILSKTGSKSRAKLQKLGAVAGHYTKRGTVSTAKNIGTYVGAGVASNVKHTTRGAVNFASSLLKEDKANSLLGYRVNKKGLALAAGISAVSSATKETKQYFTQDLKGRSDGQVTPYAPRMTGVGNGYGSYGQQAGATGDLVFALNKNRRG